MITPPLLDPCPSKEMRLHQQPRQIRVLDRLAHPRVEARRRPQDHVVVLEHDPCDKAGPRLIADIAALEEGFLDGVHRPPRRGVVGDEPHRRV